MLSVLASPASVDAVTLEEMTSAAIECIISHEGTYNSINPNDCGAVSVGKLQWHADRALALMRKTCEKNPAFAEATLGTDFYNEVMSATNWNYRTFSSSEAAAAAVLLGSEYGVQAQDETAAADVQNYIISGQNMGMTDAGALVLYADIYNFGCGIAARIAKRAASYTGSYASVTLDDMYQAALSDSYGSNSAFVSRANNVYAYLTNKDWSVSAVTTTTTTTTPAAAFSPEGAGTYTVNATSLNMRSGPGTGYSIVTQIPSGAEVTVTETNGSWAAVTYGSFNGYCSMDYLVKAEMTTTEETTTTTTAVSTETTVSADTTTTEETTTTAATTAEMTTTAEETTTTTTTTTVTETTAASTTVSEETTTEATTTATSATTSATAMNIVLTNVVVNDSYATLYGDINCDGSVNVADAVLLQKFLSGSIQLNLEQIANSDCSYDGTLSTADIIVILQHLVGHYTALPIL